MSVFEGRWKKTTSLNGDGPPRRRAARESRRGSRARARRPTRRAAPPTRRHRCRRGAPPATTASQFPASLAKAGTMSFRVAPARGSTTARAFRLRASEADGDLSEPDAQLRRARPARATPELAVGQRRITHASQPTSVVLQARQHRPSSGFGEPHVRQPSSRLALRISSPWRRPHRWRRPRARAARPRRRRRRARRARHRSNTQPSSDEHGARADADENSSGRCATAARRGGGSCSERAPAHLQSARCSPTLDSIRHQRRRPHVPDLPRALHGAAPVRRRRARPSAGSATRRGAGATSPPARCGQRGGHYADARPNRTLTRLLASRRRRRRRPVRIHDRRRGGQNRFLRPDRRKNRSCRAAGSGGMRTRRDYAASSTSRSSPRS